jgi:hypothetical protein
LDTLQMKRTVEIEGVNDGVLRLPYVKQPDQKRHDIRAPHAVRLRVGLWSPVLNRERRPNLFDGRADEIRRNQIQQGRKKPRRSRHPSAQAQHGV